MYLRAEKFLFYLLLILPFSLITGPFLPDLIISISSIVFLLILFNKRELSFLKNDFFIIISIFYFLIVINSAFSEQRIISLKNTFFYFRFFIFAYLIKYLILKQKNFLKNFSISIFLILLIVSLDAMLEFFLGYHWLFDKTRYAEFTVNSRISGLFDEEYILGGFILSLFPTAIILFKKFVNKNSININFFYFVTTLIFIFSIIISGERTSLVKLLILLIALFLFSKILPTLKIKLISLFFLIVFVFVTIFSIQPLKERLIYHTLNSIFQNNHEQKINEKNTIFNFFKNKKMSDLQFTYFSVEHHNHALISLNMFEDKKIFGHGVKMFRFMCSKDKYYINDRACSTHSHGIILTFLSETGLIGLAFLFLSYIVIIKNFFISQSNLERTLLISIFLYLFPLLPSGYFFNNYYSIILYILIGIYIGIRKGKNLI